jgi:hypothetical protein
MAKAESRLSDPSLLLPVVVTAVFILTLRTTVLLPAVLEGVAVAAALLMLVLLIKVLVDWVYQDKVLLAALVFQGLLLAVVEVVHLRQGRRLRIRLGALVVLARRALYKRVLR